VAPAPLDPPICHQGGHSVVPALVAPALARGLRRAFLIIFPCYNKGMTKKATLLWLDMEMTGLYPDKDLILEVAVILTDWDFKEITRWESGIHYDETSLKTLLNANDFYNERPDNKQQLLALSAHSPTCELVEKELLKIIKKYGDPDTKMIIAGNSIHQDRRFVRAYMPRLDAKLHYRMLDVSALKIVLENKFKTRYSKKEVHRAMQDVEESIAELRYYLEKTGHENT
jgi:oligoribonuclease